MAGLRIEIEPDYISLLYHASSPAGFPQSISSGVCVMREAGP
jgi:hypothetical protein